MLTEEFLLDRDWSPKEFAAQIDVEPAAIIAVIEGRERLSDNLAARFAEFFGSSIQFWQNMQRLTDRYNEDARTKDKRAWHSV